ncbi:hypothetical protein V8E54_006849 [Elaphomyces granulatus]
MPTTDATCSPSIDESDLTNASYSVGWICTLETELASSEAMLDEEHPDLLQAENDTNTYTLGRIGCHNVVLACLPSGTTGICAAATAAKDLLRSFPKVRFGLMVGIGGGAPSNPSDDPCKDIRLGDVVVGNPEGNCGGVLQYDFGKTIKDGKFIQTGARHLRKGNAIREHVDCMLESNPAMQQNFKHRNPEDDQLFQADYDHMDGEKDCKNCNEERLVQRKSRTPDVPVVHYGLIGSANQAMKHGGTREKLRQEMGMLCFEMEAAGLMDNFPCLVIRGICDYSDTHKNKDWQPYAAVTAAAYAKELLGVITPAQVDKTPTAADAIKVIKAIKEVSKKVDKIGEGVGLLHSAQEAEYRRKLLGWLSPIDYAELQSDTLRKREAGTGEWFLKSTPFVEWLEGKKRTLFCPGIPGTGKTMIASIVVDHLKTRFPDDETGHAFIYCIYKREENQGVDNLLASLLGQLAVWKKPIIPEAIREWYNKHLKGEKPGLSRDEIRVALCSIIRTYSRTFVVIDALDECKTDQIRNELLSEVYKLQEGSDIRLMVTFRPSIEPEPRSSMTKLEIRAYKEDIEQYLSSRISELRTVVRRSNELQRKIKDRISTLVDGMFLLAQLYINSLTDKVTERQVDTALDNMKMGKEGLDKAYEDTVNRIENQQQGIRELAKKMLFWIVFAKRPLTTEELRHALAVEPGTRSLDMRDLCPVEDMVSSCAGLEYFQRRRSVSFQDVQRDIISTSCLTYLSYDVFAKDYLTYSDLESCFQQNPFFKYAAQNWGYHIQDAQQSAIDLALEFLMDDRKVWTSGEALFALSAYSCPQQFCGMHLVAYLGLNNIMMRLLEKKKDPDTRATNGWTPLSYAVKMGNALVVDLLLKYDVDLNVKLGIFTPFSLAIEGGSAAVVQLLLAQGTPLSRAAEKGDKAIIELLLKNGAQPDLEDEDGCTALSRAIEGGHVVVVQLLLAQGTKTPLSRAAEKGDKAVVELLLKNGAQPDLEDEDRCTALSRAIERGHAVVVRLLLAQGAKSRAAEKGDKAIVELLLKNGAQPDLEDENRCTALSRAIEGGHVVVVQLLLAQGAKTPLSRAAEKGDKAVVKLLLKNGAQPDMEDENRCTALSRAIEGGHAVVVQLLLAQGVKVNYMYQYAITPLSRAAEKGDEPVVELLLENGAQPDFEDGDGQTPLSRAEQAGNAAVLQLLNRPLSIDCSPSHRGRKRSYSSD